jgi:mono/diheme cytochrome c family protein
MALCGLAAGLAVYPVIAQKKPKTVWDGVYTAEQAKRGAEVYAGKCAACHGADMQGGGEAPGMVGAEFLFSWGGKTVEELFTDIKKDMPLDAPGSLSDDRCADLLAAIFQKNEFPAGKVELPAKPEALADVLIPKGKP